MCPKFDVNGCVDIEASKAAAKGCRSTASAYGTALKVGSTKRTKAKPSRHCVLGPNSDSGSYNRRIAIEHQLQKLDKSFGVQPEPQCAWDIALEQAKEIDSLRTRLAEDDNGEIRKARQQVAGNRGRVRGSTRGRGRGQTHARSKGAKSMYGPIIGGRRKPAGTR